MTAKGERVELDDEEIDVDDEDDDDYNGNNASMGSDGFVA